MGFHGSVSQAPYLGPRKLEDACGTMVDLGGELHNYPVGLALQPEPDGIPVSGDGSGSGAARVRPHQPCRDPAERDRG